MLKWFGIAESEIKHLCALDVDESRWRIDHEARVMITWAERRRDFLLSECAKVVQPPRPRTTGVISPRNTKITSISGERLA